MNPVDRASLFFQQGYSCSQAVLLAFAQTCGIPLEMAARISAGFGGGMGRMARTCGAVSGGTMVLGLRQGTSNPSDKVAKERAYQLTRAFQEEFKNRCGALDCADLLGADISTPEGLAQARAEGCFANCSKFVEESARLVAGMLLEKR